VKELESKTREELIAEIELLRSKMDSTDFYFPGLNVIRKFERLNSLSLEKYRLLFQKSNDVILVIQRNVIVECNDRTEQLFLGNKNLFIGKSIWDLCPMIQPDGSNSKEKISQFIRSSNLNSDAKLHLNMLKKNGDLFDAEINITDLTVGDENMIQTIIRDISDRIELSRLLRDEYDKRIEEQDITQSGNWEFNVNNFDVYWSPSAFTIHEISNKQNPPGLKKYFEKHVHPDEHDSLFQAIQECIRTADHFNMDYKIITGKKRIKYLHVKGKAVYNLEGQVEKIVGTVVDITDRKILELELKESKEGYETLVENMPEGVVIFTQEEILYANIGACQIVKVPSVADMKCRYGIFDFLLPRDKSEIERKIKLIFKGKKFGPVEMKLFTSKNDEIDIEARSNIVLYKGKTAIQVIFGEITYRKQVERSLQERERQMSTLISNLQGMAFRCKNDRHYTMEFVSEGCKELTGYNESELLNNNVICYNNIIIKENRKYVWEQIQKALQRKETYSVDYCIKTKHGELKWLHENGKGIFNEDGTAIAIEGFVTDISKEKNTEYELQKSHENYKNLVNFIPEGIVIHKHGKILFVNQKGLMFFGFERQEDMLGMAILDFVQPKFQSAFKKKIVDAYKGKEDVFFEVDIKSKSGKVMQVETRSIPYTYQSESCILLAIHPIETEKLLVRETLRAQIAEETNQKLKNEIAQKELAKKELLKSKEYTKSIINSSLDMILANDNNLAITEFNRAAQIIFGYSYDEVIGKPISMLYSSEASFKSVHKRMLLDGVFSGEVSNRRKNGEVFESFVTATGLFDEQGRNIGSMGVSRDITKIKKERERLHLSEERYKAIYNQVFIGIARIDLSGKYVQVNQRFCNILGYTESELLGMSFQDITLPEELPFRQQQFEEIIHSKILNFTVERKYRHKTGRVIETNVNVTLVLNEHQEPAYLVLVCEDITESKMNQELLQLQTAKLNSIIESSNYLVMAVDRHNKMSIFNTNTANWLEDVYGVKPYVGLAMDRAPIYSDEKVNRHWNKKMKEALSGSSKHFEIMITNKKGVQKIYEIFLNPVRNENTEINEVAIIAYDITEKKKTEEKIVTQSAKLTAIFQNSSHQIYTIDYNYRLTSFNELFAQTAMQDFRMQPNIGADMKIFAQLLLPGAVAQNFLKYHRQALKGKSLQTEVKVLNHEGRVSYYLIYLDPIILPDSKVYEVSYIAHDITDRKLAEKSIVESLKEKEVLLKEVHHRVKNNLQVISSILNLQKAYLKDANSYQVFSELQNRVRSMSFIHESLYQSKDFSSLNFGNYIVNLCDNLKGSYQANEEQITLEVITDNIFLNLDVSIPCGLIVNELISNAFKYAFPEGRKGKISIKVQKTNNFVEIIVADDGVGIKPEIDVKNTESLGLQLVTSLVDQLGGELTHRNIFPGTEIKFNFKILNKN
jgi:PAS domain S-box-containing protein